MYTNLWIYKEQLLRSQANHWLLEEYKRALKAVDEETQEGTQGEPKGDPLR